jgi:hypothetical protein
MRPQLLKQPITLIQLVVVLGIGVFLGLASVGLPPFLIIMAIGGVVYLMIAWSRSEIAILLILLLTSTAFDPFVDGILPSISIGIGHLYIPDVLLAVLVGIIFLRGTVESKSFFTRTPLDVPLLVFYAIAIFSTAVAVFNSTVSFNQALGEFRVISLYLLFFLVTNLVRSKEQLLRLFNGIMLLVTLVAVAMIAQYVLGPTVPILPGRVENLNTGGSTAYGVTRILPPGQSLVMFGFICLVVKMLFDKISPRSVFNLIQLGVIGVAVLVTFNRNFWTAIVLALALVGILVSFRDKLKYVRIIFWSIFIGAMALAPFQSDKGSQVEKFVTGVTGRLTSIFNPQVGNESSLLYRAIENKYAFPQIASHPIVGLGLGANFRPPDPRLSGTDYIHNGHLYVMLKTGLLGYFFLMFFMFFSIIRGLRNWKEVADPLFKRIVLSSLSVLVGVFAANFVNPIFMQSFWTPVIGVMMGMSESVLVVYHKQHLDSSSSGKSI